MKTDKHQPISTTAAGDSTAATDGTQGGDTTLPDGTGDPGDHAPPAQVAIGPQGKPTRVPADAPPETRRDFPGYLDQVWAKVRGGLLDKTQRDTVPLNLEILLSLVAICYELDDNLVLGNHPTNADQLPAAGQSFLTTLQTYFREMFNALEVVKPAQLMPSLSWLNRLRSLRDAITPFMTVLESNVVVAEVQVEKMVREGMKPMTSTVQGSQKLQDSLKATLKFLSGSAIAGAATRRGNQVLAEKTRTQTLAEVQGQEVPVPAKPGQKVTVTAEVPPAGETGQVPPAGTGGQTGQTGHKGHTGHHGKKKPVTNPGPNPTPRHPRGRKA